MTSGSRATSSPLTYRFVTFIVLGPFGLGWFAVYSRWHYFPYSIQFPSIFFFSYFDAPIEISTYIHVSFSFIHMTIFSCYFGGKFLSTISHFIELFSYIHPLIYSICCASYFKYFLFLFFLFGIDR